MLRGDAGDNLLTGGVGGDALDGGAGSDFANYFNASTGITASLANPASNTGDAAGDSYVSIENLQGSSNSDTLIGDLNDTILRGAVGADNLQGGAGSDTADYWNQIGTTGVTADLSNSANNTGDAAGDTYSSIENLSGSDFADSSGATATPIS